MTKVFSGLVTPVASLGMLCIEQLSRLLLREDDFPVTNYHSIYYFMQYFLAEGNNVTQGFALFDGLYRLVNPFEGIMSGDKLVQLEDTGFV